MAISKSLSVVEGERSVVHSDVLSERPATLAIILMARPIEDRHNHEAGQSKTRSGPPVRVDNEVEPRRQGDKMIR